MSDRLTTATTTNSAAFNSKARDKKSAAVKPSREGSGKKPKAAVTESREGSGKRDRDEEIFETTQLNILSREQLEELEEFGNDVNQVFARLALFLSIGNWKEDLFSHLHVSFHFQNYIFALDSKFSTLQTAIFLGILRSVVEQAIEKGLSQGHSIKIFKDMLMSHSSPTNAPEQAVFGPKEVYTITEYASSAIFQHFKLIMYAFTSEQEKQTIDLSLDLISLPELAPLQEAMTLADYEIALAEKKAEEEQKRLLEEERLEQERLALINPFEALDNETIKQITAEMVKSLLQNVHSDFDRMFQEQREKFLTQLSKFKE